MRHRLIGFLLAATLLLPGAVRGGLWETRFSHKADTFLDYNYASQLGDNGFFGPFNIDNSATGNFAPLNGWLGQKILSGASAATATLTTIIKPTIKFTEAVRVSAAYQIGPYDVATQPRLFTPISTGNWLWWTIDADTPWGLIYYGKRRFGYGLYLQFGATRTEEFIGLETNIFGPPTDYEFEDSPRESWAWQMAWGATRSPDLTVGLGIYPLRRGSTAYWDPSDLNSVRSMNFTAYMTYFSTYCEFQAGTIYWSFREGPESQQIARRTPQNPKARDSFPPSETSTSEGWIYFMWRNGWLSVASELDWYYRTIRFQRSADGTFLGIPDNTDGSGSLFAPRYIESWRWGTKITAARGPAILSMIYSRMAGPDRRHGILIDRQPFIQEREQSGSSFFSNHSAIVAGTYAGGVNGFSDIPGASTFAAKLNYSLAANLDLWFRVLTARRVSGNYGWGYVRPETDPTKFGAVNYAVRGSFTDPSPAAPDDNLGWEMGVGFAWELLSRWSIGLGVNYWKPGRWFNFGCVDKSVPNWEVPTSANMFGIKPDRTIDPVVTVNLQIDGAF
ncbi:MAG: hypothetical protein HY913_02115 [Desulfomonile tiedjei]|nr:hypothetical protein [Desulfomonile tiedjei]